MLDYAQACFVDGIENLLDDPSDLLHEWRNEEPAEYLDRQRRLARDLKLDFDVLIEKYGTAFERQRLRDIETGKAKPMPRKPYKEQPS